MCINSIISGIDLERMLIDLPLHIREWTVTLFVEADESIILALQNPEDCNQFIQLKKFNKVR